MVVLNPSNPKKHRKRSSHKRRRARAHSNPAHSTRRHHKKRRARRNPSLTGGLSAINFGAIALGAAGGLGTSMAVNALSQYLPQPMQSGWGKLGAKGGVVLAAAIVLPHIVGRKTTSELVAGAGIVIAVDAAREFLGPQVPGLSGLIDSPFISRRELSGYVRNGVAQLSAAVQRFSPAWMRN